MAVALREALHSGVDHGLHATRASNENVQVAVAVEVVGCEGGLLHLGRASHAGAEVRALAEQLRVGLGHPHRHNAEGIDCTCLRLPIAIHVHHKRARSDNR